MSKRIVTLLLAVLMLCSLFSIPAAAAEKLPIENGIARPEYITMQLRQANGQMWIGAYYIVPNELLDIVSKDGRTLKDVYGIDEQHVMLQTDWSVDSSNGWHYTEKWDKERAPYSCSDVVQKSMVSRAEMFWLTYEEDRKLLGDAVIQDANKQYQFDFSKHKLYVRTRFYAEIKDTSGNVSYYTSNWSDTINVNDFYDKKDKYSAYDLTKLDALTVSNAEVKYDKDNNNKPYLSFKLQYPDTVKHAALALRSREDREMNMVVERRVNGGKWENSRITNNSSPYDYGERTIFIEDDILKNGSYAEYRIKLAYGGGSSVKAFETPWSETLKYNVPSWSDASNWAKPWLEKAEGYKLIPDVLEGADMTQPITRHEFAALSVKLYEAISGKTAVAGDNPFTDVSDAEILKAVNIGITNGTSLDKFSPKAQITREQTAAMLTRAYKASFWEGWTLATDGSYTANKLDYSGVTPFADDADISAYAKPSVYFMVKNKILDGIGSNKFAPNRANIPKDAAITYGQATREAAIKMAVASYENLK